MREAQGERQFGNEKKWAAFCRGLVQGSHHGAACPGVLRCRGPGAATCKCTHVDRLPQRIEKVGKHKEEKVPRQIRACARQWHCTLSLGTNMHTLHSKSILQPLPLIHTHVAGLGHEPTSVFHIVVGKDGVAAVAAQAKQVAGHNLLRTAGPHEVWVSGEAGG